jgi:integrase
MDAVVRALPERTRDGQSFRAYFEIMRETGLRPGTPQRLRAPEDYRPGSQFLRIRAEADKARYARELPLSERAREVLDKVCPNEGILFPKFAWRYPLRTAALAAGLEPDRASKLSPYDFRHSVATELTERSGNLLGVGYLLGHRYATTGYFVNNFAPRFDSLGSITSSAMQDYSRARLRQVKRGTVCKELSAMRGFLKWCLDRGYFADAPVVKDPPARSTGTTACDKVRVDLDNDRATKLIAALPEWSKHTHYPVRDLILFVWETALRRRRLDLGRIRLQPSASERGTRCRMLYRTGDPALVVA